MADRWDPPRTVLAGSAAAVAAFGAIAAALDAYLMPLGTPVAIVLGSEAVVDAGLAFVRSDRPWSADRRRVARVIALVWVVLVPIVLGLGMAATACACTPPPGYAEVMLGGVDPHVWVVLGAIAGPPLVGAASVGPFAARSSGHPSPRRR